MSEFNMSWEEISSNNNKNQLSFMVLLPGENRVRIVSAPSKLDIHWEETLDGSKKKIICLGAQCPLCKKGEQAQVKFQMKVLDRKDNKVKILECGKQIVNAIKSYAIDPDYGDPTKYDIKIKKEGSSRDTKYSVIGVPNKTNLTDEEQALIDNSPSIEEINKIRTEEELYDMQLKVLADSIADLAEDDDNMMDNDSDWEDL